MGIELSDGLSLSSVLWLSGAAALLGLIGGWVAGLASRRRMKHEVLDAEARATKERERAESLQGEIAALRARAEPLTADRDRLFAGLVRTSKELAGARDRKVVTKTLAHAVQRIFEPRQSLVFSAVGPDGKEFHLAHVAGEERGDWQKGARINDSMGRLGLVARRHCVMDAVAFDAEPAIVRDQFQATEPAGIRVDAAAPVVVGSSVVALVSVGWSSLPPASTRAGLELLAALAAAAYRCVDASARVERHKNIDETTGLASKRWFLAESAEVVYRCRTDGLSLAVILFGIDDFRPYVERTGHQAGDALLTGIADALAKMCSANVLLARWSGGEFAMILPGATPRGARVFANRVRAAIASLEWPFAGEQPRGRLTLSAGIATLPGNGRNMDSLIEAAADNLATARWSGDATNSAVTDVLPYGDDDDSGHDDEEIVGEPGESVSESHESDPANRR